MKTIIDFLMQPSEGNNLSLLVIILFIFVFSTIAIVFMVKAARLKKDNSRLLADNVAQDNCYEARLAAKDRAYDHAIESLDRHGKNLAVNHVLEYSKTSEISPDQFIIMTEGLYQFYIKK